MEIIQGLTGPYIEMSDGTEFRFSETDDGKLKIQKGYTSRGSSSISIFPVVSNVIEIV